MKRMIFALAILLAALRASAYDIEKDGVCYDFAADGLTVTSGDAPYGGYIHIPDSLFIEGTWYSVTAIGDKAFNACTEVTGIRLPKHLKTIGAFAFAGCSSLSYTTLPSELTAIGEAAFLGCAKMGTFHIPATVTTIGDEAFVKCTNLRQITVGADNAAYCSIDGVLFDKSAQTLLAYPNAKSQTYSIPSSVTAIASWAFTYCGNVETVSLPATLTTIGDAAFYGCSRLTDLKLPSTLASVGLWAFSECESLSTLTLPASLTTIGDGAFSFCRRLQNIFVNSGNAQYCAVDGVLMSKDKTEIVAFPGGKGSSYRIPATVTSIHAQAFYGNQALTTLTLNAQLSALADNPYVFCDSLKEILVDNANCAYCAQEGVLFNKDKTAIVFYPNAKSGAYVIPETVTEIDHGPFLCSAALTELSIPNQTTTLGSWAFLGCYALDTVSIPNALTTLGEQPFIDCTALKTIICGGEPTATCPILAETCDDATLYVPRGWLSDYMAASGWSDFGDIQEYGICIADLAVEQGQSVSFDVTTVGDLDISDVQADYLLPTGFEATAGESALSFVLTAAIDSPTGVHEATARQITFAYQYGNVSGIASQPDFTFGIDVKQSTGIDSVAAVNPEQPSDIYNLQGIRVRQQASTTEGLPAGVYIVNGRKVVVK